ncbi:MAG: hypothetical protein ACI8QS_002620 [Planctomycetota bacterium]|jgi:hypothetical protein
MSRNNGGSIATTFTSVTLPVLGTNGETDLDCAGYSTSFAGLAVYARPASGFFLDGGEVLVDLTSSQVTPTVLPHTGAICRLSLAVPNDTAMCGYRSSAQLKVLLPSILSRCQPVL